MKKYVAACFLVVGFALGLAACNDSSTTAPDMGIAAGEERGPCYGNGTCNAGLTCASNICVRLPDAVLPDFARDAGPIDTSQDVTSDVLPDAPLSDAGWVVGYPPGPYGAAIGDILQYRAYQAYSDPMNFCRAHKAKVVDTTQLVALSWLDFYSPSACTPLKQRKLLWVIVAMGWNGPSIAEIKDVMNQVNTDALDPAVDLVNVLVQDDARMPVGPTFAKTWVQQLGISFPVLLDPTNTMRVYNPSKTAPVNMLVELSTMKIVYLQGGADLSSVRAQIQTYLTNNP